MRHQLLITSTILAAAALLLTAPADADDRDFLREVSAPPNLIFILDTSSSMVGSPETASSLLPESECDPNAIVVDTDGDGVADSTDPFDCSNGLRVPFAMVPGGGDDPYSRMGIAKKVLRDFLEDVGEANIALAGYAQAQPADGSDGVPQKHWVYEARAQDRFHMIESTYAYRMGYAESHTGFLLDVPADILKQRMIGYKLYFNPETTPLGERFGPLNAYDTGYLDILENGSSWPVPYDLMPIYFGNCFVDDRDTPGDTSDDQTLCLDNVFPYYDAGQRDAVSGDIVPAEWYYGEAEGEDYPGCDPNDPIWDADGNGVPDPGACQNEWEEPSGADVIQYRRRVRLEIPSTFGGSPNHFLASDGAGGYVGNASVVDAPLNQDYDLDGFGDPDVDGDEANDWMLYVNSVEERDYRTCVAGASLPTWTPTPTFTLTPTETPTPTPTPTPICRVTVDNMSSRNGDYNTYGYMTARIINGHATTATITRIYWDWGTNMRKWAYNDWMRICTDGASTPCNTSYENVWDDGTGSYSVVPYTGRYARPLEVYGPPYVGIYNNPQDAQIGAGVTTYWWSYIRDTAAYVKWDGVYEICFDFLIPGDAPGGGDLTCPNVCAVSYEGSFGTPTPTHTPSPTETPTAIVWPTSAATATRTPTSSGGTTSTPTRTPTSGLLPTSTPTPFPTSTPTVPPTPTSTRTPTRTFTPIS